ncbi:TonB-dependent receptor [Robiginitalea sp. M366]|uniref:SusC/RagA family TonB-linked outer membrane protein n=1 Tax=Robiginitalea aestuariiviva TaxID=3036903 RepID=UPI00240E154C|nr:TonB-dependent receptor [Robiginitalea aestuariiviva]MDG1572244.1 TonB-dependent receptor [Robiginitalea aestuariiviva]
MKQTLFLIFAFLTFGLQAQEIQIQGVVLDAISSEPLPGVNVIVKGTTRGTATDFDGNFSLSGLAQGEVVVFTYLGYLEQEYTVSRSQEVTIRLSEDVSALDEVVVIGYGTQTKKEITGAVSVVDAESIEELNPTRIEQALQGQVAGVQITSESGSPGSGSNIRIRGISTNGDNRPLILVDGNVIEDLSVINPSDIASINILKDATAGIYGVRAANGVILITTKTGRRNTELKFSYDAWGGLQQTSRKIPVLNATEYAVIVNEAFAAGGSPNPYPNLAGLGTGTDWQDEVFTNAPIFNHNFSANGGSEKSTYSFGASYLTQDGIVGGPKANFNRSTVRFNFNTEPIENLKLVANALYTRTNRKTLPEGTLGSVLFNALNNAPTFAVRDASGAFTLAEGLGNEVINPLAQVENTFNKTKVDRISGKVGAAYTLLEGLSAESNFQFNYAEVAGIFFAPTVFYGSGKVFNVDRNFVVESKNLFRDYTWDTFLKYDKELGDHTLNGTLGMSVFRTSGQFSGSTGFDIPGNSFTNARIENASDVIDNFINTVGKFDSRLLSYFLRLQYNYKDRYLLSGVLRRDGSTAFGPRNKFGYFPSGSLGWIVSEEDFLAESSWLNFMKLRASYGIVGNDRIAANAFRSVLSGEGAYVFDDELRFGQAVGALSNPEIQWEEQKTLDIGIDLRLFDDHISLTADYFQKRTEDLLVSPPVSGILGAAAPGSGSPVVNAGTVENKGVELAVGYQTAPTAAFSASINYNVTLLQNEVLSVNNGVGFIPGGSFGVGQDPPARMEDGKPLGYFYGLETDGVFQTQAEVDAHATQANAAPGDLRFVDQNGDGIIDSNDRTDIGNPIPDATMGLNISLGYRQWDFTAYAFASLGNEIVRNYERNQPLVNRSVYTLDRWTGPGTTTEDPRVTIGATSNTLFSDYFVEDGSFVRLQNAQLGYTFTDAFNENLGIDKLRFYLSVNNLFTLTKYRGYDPAASSGAPIGAGIDPGFYPVARTYLLGVNFKF